MKTWLLVLIILLTFSSKADNGCNPYPECQHWPEISANRLFLDSQIVKVPFENQSLNPGDNYTYQKMLDTYTHDLFRSRLAGLFHRYQDRVKNKGWQGPWVEGQEIWEKELQFTEKDNINLGVDIDFAVKKLLSSDTYITQVVETKDSPVVDGQVIENYHLIKTYRVRYRLKSSVRDHQGREYKVQDNRIHSGHIFTGHFSTDEYNINIQSGVYIRIGDVKINDLKITVIEKASRKPRKRRGNDIVRPERYKKMTKERHQPRRTSGRHTFSDNYYSCSRNTEHCDLIQGKERAHLIRISKLGIGNFLRTIRHTIDTSPEAAKTAHFKDVSFKMLKQMCSRLSILDDTAIECDNAFEDFEKHFEYMYDVEND